MTIRLEPGDLQFGEPTKVRTIAIGLVGSALLAVLFGCTQRPQVVVEGRCLGATPDELIQLATDIIHPLYSNSEWRNWPWDYQHAHQLLVNLEAKAWDCREEVMNLDVAGANDVHVAEHNRRMWLYNDVYVSLHTLVALLESHAELSLFDPLDWRPAYEKLREIGLERGN